MIARGRGQNILPDRVGHLNVLIRVGMVGGMPARALQTGCSQTTDNAVCVLKDVIAVPLPPGWGWLNELPDEWQPPAELDVPTANWATNLAIIILSDESVGHEVQAAVGRFVGEQALYMIWYVREFRQPGARTVKDAALHADVKSDQTRVAYEAWTAYRDIALHTAPSENLRERRLAARAALATALDDAATALARTRDSR